MRLLHRIGLAPCQVNLSLPWFLNQETGIDNTYFIRLLYEFSELTQMKILVRRDLVKVNFCYKGGIFCDGPYSPFLLMTDCYFFFKTWLRCHLLREASSPTQMGFFFVVL